MRMLVLRRIRRERAANAVNEANGSSQAPSGPVWLLAALLWPPISGRAYSSRCSPNTSTWSGDHRLVEVGLVQQGGRLEQFVARPARRRC